MATKTYLVQTWADTGALQNHYEVSIETPAQLKELRKFLSSKSPHVVITLQPDKPRAKR